jgi:hypothetical protein
MHIVAETGATGHQKKNWSRPTMENEELFHRRPVVQQKKKFRRRTWPTRESLGDRRPTQKKKKVSSKPQAGCGTREKKKFVVARCPYLPRTPNPLFFWFVAGVGRKVFSCPAGDWPRPK